MPPSNNASRLKRGRVQRGNASDSRLERREQKSNSFLRRLCCLKKHPKPSNARPRAVVKRNSLHSASAFRAKAACPFLPFSSQNQSIRFDFDKEEGGKIPPAGEMSAQRTKGGRGRAQFSSCLTEMAQATLSCPCGAIHLAERCELLLTQARCDKRECSFNYSVPVWD